MKMLMSVIVVLSMAILALAGCGSGSGTNPVSFSQADLVGTWVDEDGDSWVFGDETVAYLWFEGEWELTGNQLTLIVGGKQAVLIVTELTETVVRGYPDCASSDLFDTTAECRDFFGASFVGTRSAADLAAAKLAFVVEAAYEFVTGERTPDSGDQGIVEVSPSDGEWITVSFTEYDFEGLIVTGQVAFSLNYVSGDVVLSGSYNGSFEFSVDVESGRLTFTVK